MSGPLSGIRVLDLSRLLPGPYATMVLSDLGAEVDKVEDTGAGDYLRRMPPLVDGTNAVFHDLNRRKRSLAIDLKNPKGREALLRLVRAYDVLVESFRPGVLARLGLSFDVLEEANPRLVYCAITGYGQDGPLAERAGHDLNYLARAGVLGLTGPTEGPPQVPGVQLADIGGALYGVIGILAALQGRHQTGRGGAVDVSMCESALSFGLFGLASHLAGVRAPRGEAVLTGGLAPYGTYGTKDGGAVTLAALEPKFWTLFCGQVGLTPDAEALVPGPHQAKWKTKVAERIRERTTAQWREFSDEHDCCLEPVLSPSEVRQDRQHLSRGVFPATAADPAAPTPIRTPVSRGAPAGVAPRQGQHSKDILADAGFEPLELEALLRLRVITEE